MSKRHGVPIYRRILLACFWVLLSAGAAPAEPSELFTLPWGEGESAVGLVDLPEVERVGPTSFSLNEVGHLLICDGVNRCIKEFDPDGRLVAVVARDLTAYHAVMERSGIVFARCPQGRIEVFSSGRRLGEFRVPSDIPLIEGYEQGIFLVGDPAGIIVNDPQRTYYLVAQSVPEPPGYRVLESQKIQRFPGKPQPDGSSCQSRWIGHHRALLQCHVPGKEVMAPIVIETENALGTIAFKGVNPEDHLVVEIQQIQPDDSTFLEIRTYSHSGELQQKVEMPDRYYTKVYRKTFLRPDGALVQMITRPEGTTFMLWK